MIKIVAICIWMIVGVIALTGSDISKPVYALTWLCLMISMLWNLFN